MQGSWAAKEKRKREGGEKRSRKQERKIRKERKKGKGEKGRSRTRKGRGGLFCCRENPRKKGILEQQSQIFNQILFLIQSAEVGSYYSLLGTFLFFLFLFIFCFSSFFLRSYEYLLNFSFINNTNLGGSNLILFGVFVF